MPVERDERDDSTPQRVTRRDSGAYGPIDDAEGEAERLGRTHRPASGDTARQRPRLTTGDDDA